MVLARPMQFIVGGGKSFLIFKRVHFGLLALGLAFVCQCPAPLWADRGDQQQTTSDMQNAEANRLDQEAQQDLKKAN